MRVALALLLAASASGCLSFQDALASKDCGDRQSERYDGLVDEPVNFRSEASFSERLFSYSSDFEACVDQHATYSVRVVVAPGGTATCTDDPLSVVVKQQAGFFGTTLPALDPEGAAGSYTYATSGEIGLKQFSDPQYIFVNVAVGMPSTASPTEDEACLASRVSQVEIQGRYLLPKAE